MQQPSAEQLKRAAATEVLLATPRLPGERHLADGVAMDFRDTSFAAVYQRNNKRGGIKNVRCWPSCGAASGLVHRERGFCGRSIRIMLTASAGEQLSCFGQFVEAPAPGFSQTMPPEVDPNVGDEVSADLVASLSRSPEDIKPPLVPGESLGGGLYELNGKLKGWHYSWAANKHSCNSSHRFKVYAFAKTRSENVLRCVGVVSSPTFRLFCRRRRRFQVAPTAPVCKPQPAAERALLARKRRRSGSSGNITSGEGCCQKKSKQESAAGSLCGAEGDALFEEQQAALDGFPLELEGCCAFDDALSRSSSAIGSADTDSDGSALVVALAKEPHRENDLMSFAGDLRGVEDDLDFTGLLY